jgi:hypothetical protein
MLLVLVRPAAAGDNEIACCKPESIVIVKKLLRVIVIQPLTLRETVYGGN